MFHKTAEQYTEMQKTLRAHLAYWIPTLGLDCWRFNIEYIELPNDDCPTAGAMILADHVYQRGLVRFYMPILLDCDPYDLEETVCHELTHCLINPLVIPEGANRKEVEQVTVHTSKSLMRAKYAKMAIISGKKT